MIVRFSQHIGKNSLRQGQIYSGPDVAIHHCREGGCGRACHVVALRKRKEQGFPCPSSSFSPIRSLQPRSGAAHMQETELLLSSLSLEMPTQTHLEVCFTNNLHASQSQQAGHQDEPPHTFLGLWTPHLSSIFYLPSRRP